MSAIRTTLVSILITGAALLGGALPASAAPDSSLFCSGDRVYSQVLDQFGTIQQSRVIWDDGSRNDLQDAREQARLVPCPNIP